MTVRICLVTTGQPATNPRLVKEADALVEAGYDVHAIGAPWAAWAEDADRALLARRRWTCAMIDWRQDADRVLFWKSRIRHFAASRCARWAPLTASFAAAALYRVGPELAAAASAHAAHLYIAHNLGALPAAAGAAARHGARLGFDAEDFHRGQHDASDPAARAIRSVEERCLPACDYVTAASPGIAQGYAALCRRPPTVVLNVFPLASRPGMPARHDAGSPLRLYWFSQTIGRHRGLEDIVAAMGSLPNLPIELHLRGEWQPGYEEELRALAGRVGLPWTRVVCHAVAAPDEMVRLAAQYDAGLALEPGHSQNNDLALSNKVFTYVLAGLPVILTATTAQAALAGELGNAAVVIRPGDSAALAEILRVWCAEPAQLHRAQEEAWRLGATRFNWDRERQVFLDAVRGALGADATGRSLDRRAS